MNILLYCNDVRQFEAEKKKINKNDHLYLVTSNYEMKRIINESNITYIVFDSDSIIIKKETREIVEKINSMVNNVKTLNNNYLYEISYLIEGGFTQQIADLLYAIQIFEEIIEDKKIDFFVGIQDYSIEIEALEIIAKKEKKVVKIVKSDIADFRDIKKKIENTRILIIQIFINIYTHFKVLKRIIRIYKKNKSYKSNHINTFDLGIIHTSNATKHYNWQCSNIELIKDSINYKIFCYHADDAREKFEKNSFPVISVEAYLNLKKLVRDYIKYVRDTFKITRKLSELKNIKFHNMDITSTIKRMTIVYINKEKLYEVIYENIIESFVGMNKVKLLTGLGDTNFISNRIYNYLYKKMGDTVIFYKDISIIELINLELTPIYEPYSDIMQLGFFTNKSKYLKTLRNNGWKGEEIIVQPSKSYIGEEIEISDCMKKQKNKRIVLWAPSYPVAGQYSKRVFLEDNEFILTQLSKLDIDIYVKYHPNQNMEMIHNILVQSKYIFNITVFDKEVAIEELIIKSDLVITTPSIVLLDATKLNKPVICLADTCGYLLTKHLRSGFIVINKKCLDIEKVRKIFTLENKFEEYSVRCLKRQKEYIRSFYNKNNENTVCSVLKNIIDQNKKG